MYIKTVMNADKKRRSMEDTAAVLQARRQIDEAKEAQKEAIAKRDRDLKAYAESYRAPFSITTPSTEKMMDETYSTLLSLYSAQNGGDISAAERRIAQNSAIQAAFNISSPAKANAMRNRILSSLGLPEDDDSFMQEVVDAIPIDGLRKKKSRLYEELILTENEASRRKLLDQIAEIDDDIAKRGRQGEHNVLGNTLIDAVPTATQVTKFALKSALVALAANGIAYGMGASAAINGTFAKIAARPGLGYLADVAGLSGGAGGVASRVVGFYDIYHDERGGAIEELMQLSDSEGRKLDRNTIANYATMIGLVNGLLEFATPDPYTKALLSLSAGNPVRSTVARSISRAVKRGLLTYAGGVLSESTEEGLQGFAGEYIKILAQEFSNAKLGTSFNLSEDRLKKSFSIGWDAFKSSIPDMMVTGIMPFAVDTSIEVSKTVKAKKDAEKITPASKEESPAQVHTVTVDSFRNVERKFDSAEDEKSAINEYMHQVQGGATIAPEPEKGEEKSDSGKSAKEKKPAQAKTAPAPADISTVPQDGVVAFSTAPAPGAQPDHTQEEESRLPPADPNYPVIYIDNGATPWQVNEEHLTPVKLVAFTKADGTVVYTPVDEVEALKLNLARQLGISHVNVTVEQANGNTYRTEYYNMAELDRKSAGKVDNGNVYVYIDPSKQTIEGTKTDSGNTRLGAEWNPVPITKKEWDAHLADAFANGIDVSEKKDGSVIAMTKADMKALYDTLVAGRFGEKIRFQNIHAAYSFQSNYNRGKKDSKGNKIAPSPFAGWFEWTYKDENGEEHTVRVVNLESREYKGHVRKIKEAEAAEAARKAEEKKVQKEQREAEKKKLDEEKAARKAERERKKAEKEAAKAERQEKETALEKLRKDLVSLEDVNNDRKKFNAILDAVKKNEALSDEDRADIEQKAEKVKKQRGESKQNSATALLREAIAKAEKNLEVKKDAEEKIVVPEDVSESIDQQKEGIDAKAELEETGNEIESPAETEEVQEASEQVDKAEKVAEEVKVEPAPVQNQEEPASAPAQEEKKDPATEFADSLSFSIDEAREKTKKQRTEMENTVVAILDSATGADKMMAMARSLLHDAEDMLPFFPDGLPESVKSKLSAIQARLEERRQKLRFKNGERGNAMRDLAGFYRHFLAGDTEEYDVSENVAVPQKEEQKAKPAEKPAEKPVEQKQEKPAAKETKPKEEPPRRSGFRKMASPAVTAPANADRKLADAIHVENATVAEESKKKVKKADKAVEEASKKKADSLSAEEKRKQKIREEIEKKEAEYETVTIRRAYSGVVKDMYEKDSPLEKDLEKMDAVHYSFSTALDAFKRIIAMFEKTWESRPWILAGGIDKVDKNFGYVLAGAKTLLTKAQTEIENPEKAKSYSEAFRDGVARLVDLKNKIASKGRMELPEEAYMPRIEEGASPEKTSLEKARELKPLIQARVFSDMQQAFGTAASSRTAEILAEHIAMGIQLVSEATGIPSAVLLSKKVYVRFVSDADLAREQKKTDSNGQPLHDVDLKGVRGWEQYDKATGTVSIYLTKNANEKTVLHELAHGLRHLMTPEQNAEFEKVYGIPLGSEWSKDVEERFADDFTRYVDLGVAPTEGLRSIFALLRGILERVKSALGPIDTSVAVAFDRLFSGKIGRESNAVSPAGTSPTLNDIASGENSLFEDEQEAQRQLDEVRKKYEGTDRWMNAPNGEPTKLTERQWLLVRTPNFIRWFGDWENGKANGIVGSNGEPLIFYHGTRAEFSVFDTSEEGNERKPFEGVWDADYPEGMMFATTDRDAAKYYGSIVMPLFVKNYGNVVDAESWPDAVDMLDNQGYSSENIFVRVGENDGFAVFSSSNDVKSATDNVGTFSTENDNIYYDTSKDETAPIQDKDLTPEEDSAGTRDQSRSRSRDANVQNIGLQLSPIQSLRMLNSGYYLTDQLVDKLAGGGLGADENMQKIFQKEQEDRQLMKQFNLLAEASKYNDTQKDKFIEDMVFKYRLENVGKEIRIRDILEKAFAYAHCETPMEARRNFISSFSTRSAIDNLKKNLIGYKAVIVSNGKLVARSLTPRNTRIVGLLNDIGSDLGDAAYNAVFEDIKEHTDEWQDLVFNLTKRRDSIRTSVNENGDVVYSSEMSDDAVYQQYLLSFNSDYHFAPLRSETTVAERNIRGQAEEEDAEIQQAIAAVTENVRETPSMIDAEPYASMNFSNAQQAILEEHDLALAIEKKKLQERVDAEIQKAVSECEEKVRKIEAESKHAKKKIEAEMNDRIAELKGNGETREADEKRIREEYAERLAKTVREYATRLATARRLVSYAVKAKTREMNRKMLTQKRELDTRMQERLQNLKASMIDRQNRARIERSIKKKMKYNSSTHSARLFDTLQFLCAIRGTKMQTRTMAENEAIMGDLLENRSTLDTLDPTGKQQRDKVIEGYDENAYEVIAVESDDLSLQNVGVARRSDISWDMEKLPFYLQTLKDRRVNVIGTGTGSFDSGYIDKEGNVHNTTDDDIFALVEQTLNGEVSYSEWSTDAQRKLLEMLNLARGYAADELKQRKEKQKNEAVESANAMFEDIDPHFFSDESKRRFASKQLIAQKFRDAVKREISMDELEDRENLILAIEGADASLYKEEGIFDEDGTLIVPIEEAIEDYEKRYLNGDGSEKSVEQILQGYFRKNEEEVRHYVGLHVSQFIDKKEFGKLTSLWKTISALIIHPYDLARNLERFREGGGEFTKVMLREVHEFMDKKIRKVNERRKAFADLFKETFGKDIQYRSGEDLLGSKKVPEGKRALHYSEDSINAGKEAELTREQMITAYIYARGGENSKSFRNLSNRNGNMFDKNDLDEMSVRPSEFLTDEELKIANYMMEEISTRWDKMASVALEEDNIILERIPYYFPLYGTRQMVLDDGKAVRGPVITDSSTRGVHERTNGIYPMDLNGISTYLREIEKQEQYIAGRHWTKKVERLVGNRVGNIYNIVDRTYGKSFANALYLYMQRVTGGEGRRIEDLDNQLKGLNVFVSRTALAHVAFRLLTVIRQTLSTIPGIVGNVGGRNFAKAFKAVFMDNVVIIDGEEFDAIEFMKKMDYKIEYRGSGDIGIEDYKNEALSARGHNEKVDWILNLGTRPMEWMDNKIAQLVWFSNYLEQMDKLENEIPEFEKRQKEACARASDIVASTQSISRVEDISTLQATKNPFVRAAIMFTNDLFQMWNLIFQNGVAEGMEKWHSEEMAALSKTERFRKLFAPVATKVLLVPALVAACSAILSLGWVSDDDDDEKEGIFSFSDFIKDFRKEMAAYYIPVMGPAAQDSMESFPNNPIPMVSSFRKALDTLVLPSEKQKAAGFKARALQAGEYLLDTSIDASAYFGMPTDAIKSTKRVAKNNFNLFYFISTNAGYATDNLFNRTER